MQWLQVPRAKPANWKTFGLLIYRLGLLIVWIVFSLPGVILNGPIFITASVMSRKKAKGSFQTAFMLAMVDNKMYRGSCSLKCQDCRQGCPRYLESTNFLGNGARFVYLLRILGHIHSHQGGISSIVDIMDSLSHSDGPSGYELRGLEVRGGWNGCAQVSLAVHCTIAGRLIRFPLRDRCDHLLLHSSRVSNVALIRSSVLVRACQTN